jgi:serine/threonine-protein kinase PknG
MDGDKCRQPGCDGVIESGFCNRCGLEPVGATAMPATVPAPLGPLTSARSSPASAVSGRGSGSSRRGTAGTRSSSRRHLGLGVVHVQAPPMPDPEQAIMAEPKVPEHKRFCSNPDCHDAHGNPTALKREAGFCPQCGKRYSLIPTLRPGDVVDEQYEVKGCLAFGGLGWLYLAKDTALGRWVVLKGLLNTEDEAAAAAAVAERQFLAAVKHANIVGIYNFAKRGAEGYIVMEFVNGITVKELRKKRGPLPPAEAIAYIHRILGAFAYLHMQGMVYCDFKPDNFMLEGDPPDVKLIDLGGVRRIDDLTGDIYGTKGYSAPEAGEGPTIVSDLYTIGRALAVLVMDFRFQSAFETSLPSPAEQPVLAQYDSLHRFLLRATAQDPDLRFQSADEMSDQLAGVLREVASESGTPQPAESVYFGGDVLALRGADDEDHATGIELLPNIKGDATDPAAAFLLSTAAVTDPKRQAALLEGTLTKYPESAELRLQVAKTLIGMGDFERAERFLVNVETRNPFDWRVTWYRGMSLLAQGKAAEAHKAFDRVYSELPGELAVKLAVAIAAEQAGDQATAIRLYDIVSRTDSSFGTAAFGLARCLTRAAQRKQAVSAYQRVSASSSLYVRAQISVARTLMQTKPVAPSLEELQKAAEVVEALALEDREQARLRAEVLENTLTLLGSRALQPSLNIQVLGRPLQDTPLRLALESALRQLAHWETDRARQIALVDQANAVRPVTWV